MQLPESVISSSRQAIREPIKYSREDIECIELWGEYTYFPIFLHILSTIPSETSCRNNMALPWYVQYGS